MFRFLTAFALFPILLNPASAGVGPEVRINELLAIGDAGYLDEDGDREDWIEIENRSGATVSLEGWTLTDDPGNPRKWVFPAVEIEAGGMLVVFASGKDRRSTVGAPLHANFKLSKDGEPLFLFNSVQEEIDAVFPSYPSQVLGASYGWDAAAGGFRYLVPPTPGVANNLSTPLLGIAPPVQFSLPRGFYDRPVQVELSVSDPGSSIYYTTDGNTPSETTGSLYTGSLDIDSTTFLRAVAEMPGYLPSKTETHTYFIGESGDLAGLPALAIVSDTRHLFGEQGILGHEGGVYENRILRGRELERPVSIEYIDPQDNSGFQIDAGLRTHGNDSQRIGRKPSFRAYMREDYGAESLVYPLMPDSEVEEFRRLVFRGGHQDNRNPFITDEVMRRLHADMGHLASHGTFVNYFINGEYYGYYNPVERLSEEFAQAWTGSSNEWDVIRQGSEATDGDTVEWNMLLDFVDNRDLTDPANYLEVNRRLDVVNFIDYLLVNFYGSIWDWPHNNWGVARERVAGGKFRFMIWDAEGSLGNRSQPSDDPIEMRILDRPDSEISRIYLALAENADFRRLFAFQFRKHFYEDGVLTDSSVTSKFLRLRRQVLGVIPRINGGITSAWVPRRRHNLIKLLQDEGLLQPVESPVKGFPDLGEPPDPTALVDPGTPDLAGINRVDAVDLLEFKDQWKDESFGRVTFSNPFWRRIVYPVGRGIRTVLARDLNGDGFPELITVNADYGTVLVLRNRGGGRFDRPEYWRGGLGSVAVTAGDFNSDGLVDLATANDDFLKSTVSILTQQPDGAFRATAECFLYNATEVPDLHPRSISAQDLDGDSRLDIVVTHESSVGTGASPPDNFLSFCYGNPSGGFEPAVRLPFGSTDLTHAYPLAWGDFHLNGQLDLIGLRPAGGLLKAKNLGGRIFSELSEIEIGSFFPVTSVAAADMTGDAIPDLIASVGQGRRIYVVPTDPISGPLGGEALQTLGARPEIILAADMDSDGDNDAIAVNLYLFLDQPSTIEIFLNDGLGNLTSVNQLRTDEDIDFPEYLEAADVDADGDMDLVAGDEFLGRLTVFLNQLVPSNPSADINGDSRIDPLDLLEIGNAWYETTGADSPGRSPSREVGGSR